MHKGIHKAESAYLAIKMMINKNIGGNSSEETTDDLSDEDKG